MPYKNPVMRRAARGGLVALTLLVLVAGAIAFAYPAAAALACPKCYGFQPAGSGLFVEAGAGPVAVTKAISAVAAGRSRVADFYGGHERAPRILVCATQVCYDRVGGGASRGMTLLDFGLLLSPRGTTPTIAAHELSHAALHTRLGLVRTWRRDIPQWFDEGVAVIVSNDARYVGPSGKGRALRCGGGRAPPDRAARVDRARRQRFALSESRLPSRPLDGRARRFEGVVALIDSVANGTSFDTAYRRLRPRRKTPDIILGKDTDFIPPRLTRGGESESVSVHYVYSGDEPLKSSLAVAAGLVAALTLSFTAHAQGSSAALNTARLSAITLPDRSAVSSGAPSGGAVGGVVGCVRGVLGVRIGTIGTAVPSPQTPPSLRDVSPIRLGGSGTIRSGKLCAM